MIHVEALHKNFGTVRALNGLDMTVEAGTVFGFLGPNGAGKTTTLRILAGLAYPTTGRVSLAGIDVTRADRKLSHIVGYLPEEPTFYPWMRAVEFLDYVGRLHGLSAADRASRAQVLLEVVKLAESGKRRIGGYSHGMRQRLGLAAAMIHKPEVLLLDEPISALDPEGRKEILELINHLSGECTILMSTHILADVERVCNVVGIIAEGRMIVQSPRQALLEKYAQPVFEAEGEDLVSFKRWAKSLQRQKWIAAASMQGNVVRVTVNDLALARRELLASAVAQQVTLRRFEELRPSLEDVFLQLVNKKRPQ